MTTQQTLASISVHRAAAGEPTEIARDALAEALDYAYRSYSPAPGEELPPREAFGIGESSNIGADVVITIILKAFAGAVAKKTVDALWDLASAYLRNEKAREVEVVDATERENAGDGKAG